VLTEAASRYADDMITGADITAATGRPPRHCRDNSQSAVRQTSR